MTPLEKAELRSRLWHIHNACETLLDLTKACDADEYRANAVLRLAAERLFITIGEAVNRSRAIDATTTERITNASAIVAFRNQLIHNYPQIDDDEVFRIIHTNLPLLLTEVRALLAE